MQSLRVTGKWVRGLLARPSEYRVTLVEVVGKIRELRKEARLLCSQQASALPILNSPEYSPGVAAYSATGLGNPSSHATAPFRSVSVSLRLHSYVMAAVRGTPSGVPVSLTPGFQPAYSCHPFAWKRKWQLPMSRS